MDNVEQQLRNTRDGETTDNVSDNGPRPELCNSRNNDQNCGSEL